MNIIVYLVHPTELMNQKTVVHVHQVLIYIMTIVMIVTSLVKLVPLGKVVLVMVLIITEF
jgi:hypothetical protein